MKKKPDVSDRHESVLLDETVGGLLLKKGDTAIDATAGSGGHSKALAKKLGAKGTLLVIDADKNAIAETKRALKGESAKIIYMHGNFRKLKYFAKEAGITEADGVVFDLGWRIEQLNSGKGLSFRSKEPLLMTLGNPDESLRTAKDIIANWDESEIEKMLRELGDERFSKRIAHAIHEARKRFSIETAEDLSEIVWNAVPGFYRHGKLHPATKTFQALRIAVNEELEALKEGLKDAMDILSDGGRVAVISFHSLEDRIVKHMFRDAEDSGFGVRVTKKPIVPTLAERTKNARSRSAKLRIFEKKHGKA